ncbi:MAG: Osmosensitive channel His kinase sensor, partial [Deltaproteobacteria bacterium]|nr:Osmosensitive channel His kinase sensor [Deltaproteobacteria bacterium]
MNSVENKADTFLRMIRRAQRGHLKIYLGYAAGVGKTYQMLLEGHRLKEEGIDVVVGLVETHGRIETERLLKGLESIPRRRQEYRGIAVEELDGDAILNRKPQVALIDELAHTNVPGSRNDKRYQDVQDILAAGVHVITTLNIQHLETL